MKWYGKTKPLNHKVGLPAARQSKRQFKQHYSMQRRPNNLPQTQRNDNFLAISPSPTLTPLADFTDALSGEQYVSVSSVKPALHLFQSSVLAVKEDDSDLIRTIKSKIVGYLEEKYNDQKTQDLLDMATTLDPR